MSSLDNEMDLQGELYIGERTYFVTQGGIFINVVDLNLYTNYKEFASLRNTIFYFNSLIFFVCYEVCFVSYYKIVKDN